MYRGEGLCPGRIISAAQGQAQWQESGICVICCADQICLTYFGFCAKISCVLLRPLYRDGSRSVKPSAVAGDERKMRNAPEGRLQTWNIGTWQHVSSTVNRVHLNRRMTPTAGDHILLAERQNKCSVFFFKKSFFKR